MNASRLLGWLAIAIALYAAVIALLYLGQRRLMYFPDARRPDPVAAGVPELAAVSLRTADGLDLLAWYRPAPAGAATLVYFHGNAGHLGDRAAKLRPYLDAGLGVVITAYRGYSGNVGRPSEAGLYHDGRAALEFLKAQGVPLRSIVVYGESLGCAVAIQLATEQSVAAIVLEAPFTSMAAVAQHHYSWTPARWLVRDRFDNLAKIERVTAPVLIVHGMADRVVPATMGEQLHAAAGEPKRIALLPRANHNDTHRNGSVTAVLGFITGFVDR